MSAVAILAGGLILGALIVYLFARRKAAAAPLAHDTERRELEAKRDALVEQLRALEPGNDLERQRLERETADVLRALDKAPAPKTTIHQPPAAKAAPAMSPALQGFLWGVGSFTVLAVLAYFVMKQSNPRTDNAQAMQQAPQQQQPMGAQQQQSPVVAQLEAAVQRDPNNLQLRNDLAQAYLETNDLMQVFEQTKIVLAKSPNDSRALTFQALVRVAMGEQAAAIDMLQRASRSDPKNLDSWVGLAWVHTQNGDAKNARAAIDSAVKNSPENRERLESVYQQMQQQAQMAASQMPADHPPVGGGQTPAETPAPAQSAGAKPPIRITLDVDAGARSRVNANGVIFIIARNPAGGPPVAVKRVNVGSFPMTVELSSADSMMGQPLPDRVRVEARADSDGDAMTRPATDPFASQDGVVPGAAIRLALK